jgi:NAD(P) transhydrogenase subunit alpha
MASIGGYKAMVRAADASPTLMPMQMTAAGTVHPADVFVVGAGVAGLQAIATGERLGASVRAYDIRPEVKEEVESLGAEFVELDLETDDASDEEGHAREQDEEFYRKQREMMTRVVADSDVVITTAAIPGQPAPELVTADMIAEMDPGAVIVDLAAETGGNCEPTQPDERIEYQGVQIFGPTNLPGTVPKTASKLYANNVTNFLENICEDGALAIDTSDEIVDATMLTHQGRRRRPQEDDDDEGQSQDADEATEVDQ